MVVPHESWHGSWQLRQGVLSHLQEHHKTGTLAPVVLGGQSLELFGLGDEPVDVGLLAKVLGLPPELLAIGLILFEGTTGADRVRRFIEERIAFFGAIPVGKDLRELGMEFALRRLIGDELGMIRYVDDDELREMIRGTALALIEPANAGEQILLVDETLLDWQRRVPVLFREQGFVEARVHHHIRALETARAALAMDEDPLQAAELVRLSVHGSRGSEVHDPAGQFTAMREELLTLLREAR